MLVSCHLYKHDKHSYFNLLLLREMSSRKVKLLMDGKLNVSANLAKGKNILGIFQI